MAENVMTFCYLSMNAWQDIKKKEIFLWTTFLYSAAGIILAVTEKREIVSYMKNLCAVLLVFFIMALFWHWTDGALGMGDNLILLSMGIVLGVKIMIVTFLTALLTAAGFSGILLCLGRAGRKTEIPFVPFLLIGYAGGLWIW